MDQSQTPTTPTTPTEPVDQQVTPQTEPVEPSDQFQQQPQPDQQQAAPEPTTQEPEPTGQEPQAGVVPKPSEYQLPEGVPDTFRIFAHENGMSQAQLDKTISFIGTQQQGMMQAEQQALRKMGEAHVKNWGPEARTNMALAKATMNYLDGQIPGFAERLTKTDVGNDPMMLEALRIVGKSMQEGGFLKSAVPRKPGDRSVAQSMYGGTHPSKEN